MLVRLDVPQDLEVVVTARADSSHVAGGRLALSVNSTSESEQTLVAQPTRYTWRVPADRWRPGTNRLLLRSEGADGASLQVSVTDVRLRR